MIVRPATPADADAIALVHIASWREAYAGLMPDAVLADLDVSARARNWRRSLEAGRPLWVAVDDDVVGFVAAGRTRDRDDDPKRVGEIGAIYLRASHWGRGIGRSLAAAALSDMQERGFTPATLWVLSSNVRARGFYERLGFELDGAVREERLGDEMLREIRYRSALTELR